jgi:predicted ABC-type transport system involved in lysophospholipase L1 biosynthesis ATPase subunit
MTLETSLVRLEGVSRVFDGGAVTALKDVDLTVRVGDCLAIVGRSGSGKSCVINMLSGIDTPTRGVVYWKGDPVTSQRRWRALRSGEIGIVFQEFNLLPTLTAFENVELPLFDHGLGAAERAARVSEALADVEIAHRARHLPSAMSGGERQRVAIARALVNRPSLLLADEPTGNLDSASSALVAELIFDLQRARGTTLVMVTHDEALARRCARCVRISDGRIVESEAATPGDAAS